MTDKSKRDFLKKGGQMAAVCGAGVAGLAALDAMGPDEALRHEVIEVELSDIKPGQGKMVRWRGKPLFIRRRTPAELAELAGVDMAELKDKQEDSARVKPGHEEWLVVVGVCTHLACVPLGTKDGQKRGEFDGWFCSCHGAHYDASGRVRKGPAPKNLIVPPYEFLSDTLIKVG